MTEPTTTEAVDADGVRDFTLPMKPHKFKIDDDVFAAPAVMSPVTLQRMAGMHASLSGTDASTADGIKAMLAAFGDIFKILLPGPSGRRFAERLKADGASPDLATMAKTFDEPAGVIEAKIASGEIAEDQIIYLQPIDLTRQVLPIFYWLLEKYGLRPTQQSSPSPSDSGTGALTDGAPETAPTGEASLEPINS